MLCCQRGIFSTSPNQGDTEGTRMSGCPRATLLNMDSLFPCMGIYQLQCFVLVPSSTHTC